MSSNGVAGECETVRLIELRACDGIYEFLLAGTSGATGTDEAEGGKTTWAGDLFCGLWCGGDLRVFFLRMHTIKAIYPGTFDPLTNGHLDLIARGAKIVDQLVVAILRNSEKGTPLFTVPERQEMIHEATRGFGNVSVTTFDGLLVDFARQQGAKAVLRGIRAISDYEYEFQMAMMNRKLDPELETLFMMPAEKYTYVSSRLIKGVFQLGGDVTALVPPLVVERLKAKVPERTPPPV